MIWKVISLGLGDADDRGQCPRTERTHARIGQGVNHLKQALKRVICKAYRSEALEIFALRDLSMHVREGEFIAVTGPSGCGKLLMEASCSIRCWGRSRYHFGPGGSQSKPML